MVACLLGRWASMWKGTDFARPRDMKEVEQVRRPPDGVGVIVAVYPRKAIGPW